MVARRKFLHSGCFAAWAAASEMGYKNGRMLPKSCPLLAAPKADAGSSGYACLALTLPVTSPTGQHGW